MGIHLLSAIAATTLLISVNLSAEQVSFEINAVIDQVIDPGKVLTGQINKGDMIRGTYTYNTNAIDTDSSSQYGHFNQLNYDNNGFNLQINKLATKNRKPNKALLNSRLFHTINLSNGKTDYYYIESNTDTRLGKNYILNSINLEIFDYSGNALSSDKLTLEPPAIKQAEDKNITISGTKINSGDYFDLKAHITAITKVTSVADQD